MTRTTNHSTSPITAEGLIRRRAQQAATAFEDAKAKFTEDFTTNPKYAIEWHAEKVARAQVHHEWWMKLVHVMDRRGVHEAMAYAARRIEIEVDSFFGSACTCLWTNALRRTEAEVFHAIARRELPELHRVAEERDAP